MGTRASKQDKTIKQQNEQIKQIAVNTKKQELIQIRNNIITFTETKQNLLMNLQNTHPERSVVTQEPTELFLINTAIQQIDRNNKTLIKADLIAIILSLKPDYINMINELQTKFTVEDLNSLIRNIIYDPKHIQSRSSLTNIQIVSKNRLESIQSNSTRSLGTVIEEKYDLI